MVNRSAVCVSVLSDVSDSLILPFDFSTRKTFDSKSPACIIEASSMDLTVALRQGFLSKERFCLVFKKTRITFFHLKNCLPSRKTDLNKITDDLCVA